MNKPDIEFHGFSKIARWKRDVIVTEKIDGTNATVYIDGSGQIFAASRNRWITPADDNYTFAQWVDAHKAELLLLGPGWHRGEWWGNGIQRGYGEEAKRFSLFNVSRYCNYDQIPTVTVSRDPKVAPFTQIVMPPCVRLVPVLYSGPNDANEIAKCLLNLGIDGSRAAPGFMKPEGIVIYHPAANVYFKQTIENDDKQKGQTV